MGEKNKCVFSVTKGFCQISPLVFGGHVFFFLMIAIPPLGLEVFVLKKIKRKKKKFFFLSFPFFFFHSFFHPLCSPVSATVGNYGETLWAARA
jgi:hypothetical protein